MISIRKVEYKSPSGIDSSYWHPIMKDKIQRDLLIVAFKGKYPPGSLGNDHGHYMSLMAMHGLLAFNPSCLIIDLRELEYEHGNTLLSLFQEVSQHMDEPDETPFPVLVVTSEKSRRAFLSLVAPTGAKPPAFHFDDLKEAIMAARAHADYWLDN